MKTKKLIATMLAILLVLTQVGCFSRDKDKKEEKPVSNQVFSMVISNENKDLEDIVRKLAAKEKINIEIAFDSTANIVSELNTYSGNKQDYPYDAVWLSNSIWYQLMDDPYMLSKQKGVFINPIVFGMKQSQYEALKTQKETINTIDLINYISDNKLNFILPSVTQTNAGMTSYLNIISSLLGSPDVIKKQDLTNDNLKTTLQALYSQTKRSAGNDEYLSELFINNYDDYDSFITYESNLIELNNKLTADGKEPVIAIYPNDGVSLSDSPLSYIDKNNDNKKESFEKLQFNLLNNEETVANITKTGRRTFLLEKNANDYANIFKKEWGIDLNKEISSMKLPTTEIIKETLSLYQDLLKKPTITFFLLDYSGSMEGRGKRELTAATELIFSEAAKSQFIQYNQEDIIYVLPFNESVIDVWQTTGALENTLELQKLIDQREARGGTDIYGPISHSMDILLETYRIDELKEKYNVSIVLMTDGKSSYNIKRVQDQYQKEIIGNGLDIPIYSIMFGSASDSQLEPIAKLSNGRVFDGKDDLVASFKEMRSYN